MSRTRMTSSAAALAIVTVATLLGCAAQPTALTPAEVIGLLEKVPGVIAVEEHAESAVTVTVATESPDAEVIAAAASIAQIATDATWEGTMSLTRENPDPYDAELDMVVGSPWRVEVFPTSDLLADELAEILLLEKLADTASLTVIDGWPYISLSSIDSFADTFRAVIANPLFADGGTVSLAAEDRLRIVWVPKRTSIHAIEEIVSISRDYPAAEVLLEAPTAGPQWPTLYIARISDEEAAVIEARLLDPALADADVDGYGLPFILRTIGSEGPTYRDGNFGGVIDPT